MRSLVVKLGMLALTIGLVFWIGWPAPDPLHKDAAVLDDATGGSVRSPLQEGMPRAGAERFERGATAAGTGALQETGVAVRSVAQARLDLNRADAKALESLPGIGAVLAQRVIEYRTTVGRFQTVDDLRSVKGIGPKIFERIRPLVMVATAETNDKVEKRPL